MRSVRLLGLLLAFCLVRGAGAGAGIVEEKFEGGGVRLRYQTDAEGRKDGSFTEFDRDGKEKVKALYKMGELHGPLTRYEAGKIILTQNFQEGKPIYSRSPEEMKKKLQEIQAAPADGEERQAGLRRLKAYRYVCGVPYADLTLDEEFNKSAEAAARICQKIGRLDHRPPNPGLPEAEYKRALNGAAKSNLAAGYPSIARAVDTWMDDSDGDNIDRLGHRRWCLNPRMAKTGFGQAGRFQAMYVFDWGRRSVPDFDRIGYPAAGLMPAELFRPRAAWSVTLNPARYQKPGEGVETRVYELDTLMGKIGDPLKLDYSKVDTQGFGIPNCIIFRPARVSTAPGKRYLVEIDGAVRNGERKARTIRYVVEFASLK
jgi:hypothetical protein